MTSLVITCCNDVYDQIGTGFQKACKQSYFFPIDLVAPVLIDVGPLPRLTNPNPVFTWTVNEEAVFECAIDDLENYKWCGNGTKGKWQGKDLNPGDYEFILRVKDPQGNTNNLIRHKFVVGKLRLRINACENKIE